MDKEKFSTTTYVGDCVWENFLRPTICSVENDRRYTAKHHVWLSVCAHGMLSASRGRARFDMFDEECFHWQTFWWMHWFELQTRTLYHAASKMVECFIVRQIRLYNFDEIFCSPNSFMGSVSVSLSLQQCCRTDDKWSVRKASLDFFLEQFATDGYEILTLTRRREGAKGLFAYVDPCGRWIIVFLHVQI